MANGDHLNDQAAAELFRDAWPASTDIWGGTWLRGRPSVPGISLFAAGAEAGATVPDALWIRTPGDNPTQSCDIIAIEVCGSLQNFSDKRSRYAASTSALQASLPGPWLTRPYRDNVGEARWRRLGLKDASPRRLAVRHLRVLYALTAEDYARWSSQGVLAAHEFLTSHSSLATITAARFRAFLKRMCPEANLYLG